jgi:hypothetical protein
MYKVILATLLLIFMLACQKEETTTENKRNTNPSNQGVLDVTNTASESSTTLDLTIDTMHIEYLKEFMKGRSGIRLPYYGRYSHTSTNYLLGQEPGFVATEIAHNTDSLDRTIFKRHDPEIVNIGGILCGIWSITHQYKDGSEDTDIYFSRDTSVNYFVVTTYTSNTVKFTHNFMRVERDQIAMMDYYDFDFKKWKKKASYTIKSKSTAYRDRLASKINNSNIFRFTHV